MAFVVQDGWQNRGLKKLLFTELLRGAQARGHRRFRAYVLADNSRMLDLIRRFGTIEERVCEQGVVELTFTAAADGALLRNSPPHDWLGVGTHGPGGTAAPRPLAREPSPTTRRSSRVLWHPHCWS